MNTAALRNSVWPTFLVGFLVLLGTTAIRGIQFYRQLEEQAVARFSSHRWQVPSKMYAEPLLLYPGMDIVKEGLLQQLAQLDYQSVGGPLQAAGEYRHDPQKGEIHLFLRTLSASVREHHMEQVGLVLHENQIERLVDLNSGTDLESVELEPEVITGLYDELWSERRIVKLYDVPSLLVKALLAAEDQRFFDHEGIDPWRIIGAGWANFLAGRSVQGGSTLTQQLVKNFFLSQEKTLGRKLLEVCMALIIENHYSKLEILENYLNEIYLGQRGAKGIFGVWEAARFYFGKELRDLTLGEMAILAGMVKAPNRHTPTRHPALALARRNYVLLRMYEIGDVTQSEYQAALQESLSRRAVPVDINAAPYFADMVRKDLEERYPGEVLTTAGLGIFTSLDMHLQHIAEEVVQKGLEGLEAAHPRLRRSKPEERLQACLIALQPQTGEIRALVGGRDYASSQFNRVTQAHRQPGSVFKPVVYLAGLIKDRQQQQGRFQPGNMIEDSPFTWHFGDENWRPKNYGKRYHGMVTIRRALEQSLNAATANLARQIGLKAIKETAQKLGFVSRLPLYPSLVLGAAEVTPLEVAVAFSTLANQGVRIAPLAVKRVLNQEGETLEHHPLQVEETIHQADAYQLTNLLEGVLERGTARDARKHGFDRPAAGKTGTTNDYGDAWFVGYTPDLVVVVWVGFDQRAPLELSGGQAALPIWTEFMKQATAGRPVVEFVPPPRTVMVSIDQVTGYRATDYCPTVIREAFYNDEAPTVPCPYHPPPPPPVETFLPPEEIPVPGIPPSVEREAVAPIPAPPSPAEERP